MATATTITERKPSKFEPRTIAFPADVKEEINKWLYKNIESLKKRLANLHNNKVPAWRKIIDGKPKEENKSWPFPNCSNLVHQLAGQAVDDLAARVLQLIWLTAPLVYFRYFQSVTDSAGAAANSKKAKTLETFIDYVSTDPRELDLYTRENKWFVDSAGLGEACICVAPEHRMEAVFVGYHEDKKKTEFDEKVLYEGPEVINLRYEDILSDPDIEPFEKRDPIVRICTLSKRKLQERTFKGHFIKAETEKIIGNPDRHGPSEIKKRENQKKGIQDGEDQTMAEWDIYECYFSWYHNKMKFRLIAWYHLKSKTVLNCVYNFIPENQVPIVRTRLSVDGKGFAEMLKDNQAEVSTTKNQRNDAMTWGILGINTLSPQNKNIDRNFTVWPGITIPAGKDDFNHYEVANPAMSAMSLQNEQAMIQQAYERAGVGPAVAGSGSGTTNKKGQYSAMGTIATMQDNNTRASHRQSDFRHSHVKLIALLTDFYGFLGLGRKGSVFGLDDKILQEALDDFVGRKLRIPIRAATASVNKEVTKQNEIMLNQAVSAYIKETSQQMQALMNPTADAGYKKWLRDVVMCKTRLMQQIIRDFQLSDSPQEFIPDIELKEEKPDAQAPQNPQAGAGPDKLAQMAQLIRAGGRSPGTPGAPGMGGAPPGLPGEGGV